MARVMIIDDDEMFGEMVSDLIRDMGHEALAVPPLPGAAAGLPPTAPEVVFLSLSRPEEENVEILGRLRSLPDPPEIILLTGAGTPEGAELARSCGVWDALSRYSPPARLTLALAQALHFREAKKAGRSRRALRREGLVGNSPGMQRCYDFLARAADSDAPVLILGETGTGKELVALTLHANSRRAIHEFVAVNCAALPAATLPEALLEKTRQGTLFLDEVGELPFSLQEALVQRLRGSGLHPGESASFRLAAAAGPALESRVAAGGFNPALFSLLQPLSLTLPPLRERPEDLQDLVLYHVAKLCEGYGLPLKGFAGDFLPTLRAYPWPGNIRELVSALEQAVTAARNEPTLAARHLPGPVRHQGRMSLGDGEEAEAPSGAAPEEKPDPRSLPPLRVYREKVWAKAEKEYLQQLFTLADYNFPAACRLSGLSQPRLYALLKKHRLNRLRKSLEK
uniref:Sigma-54-dependent Fis family transcriptional regulator n=1 Tax=Desulfobacca acetoxidans TaxID=60893 RepID=A0A7V4G833_9BACT